MAAVQKILGWRCQQHN